jgi:hypothetical protein
MSNCIFFSLLPTDILSTLRLFSGLANLATAMLSLPPRDIINQIALNR